MLHIKKIAILVSLALVSFSCAPNLSVNDVPQINSNVNNSKLIIRGKVEFPGAVTSGASSPFTSSLSPFTTKATLSEVGTQATVSLITSPDSSNPNITIATGPTDTSGNFYLSPVSNFSPEINQIYLLEASKRIGSSGNDLISVKTYIRWNGNNWDSITNPGIYINSKTTALTIIDSYDSNLSAAQTIHSVNVSGGNSVPDNQIGGSSITKQTILDVDALVNSLLLQNADPVKYISFKNSMYYINEEINHSLISLNTGFNCSNCNLKNEDMSNKNYNYKDLRNSNLSGAILKNSTLQGTNLTNSNLSKADFSNTDLTGANLAGANLTGTILSDATWTDGKPCSSNSIGVCISVISAPVATSATHIDIDFFKLNWNVVSGATGYKLFVDGVQYPDKSTVISSNSYTVSGLSSSTDHSYYVVAINNGGISSPSNTINLKTLSNYVISTIAGGILPENIPATASDFDYPYDVAVDSTGNIYIAEYYGSRIRKVDASTGSISTIAGNPDYHSYSGDGGQATSASLYYPNGVAVDKSGNIYIADTGNNRIRKVDASTGIITTVAGNGTVGYSGDGVQATSAQLNYPKGLAVDSGRNIYISDSSNNKIRKVDVSTGIISTVAGTGIPGYSGDGGQATSAQLNSPEKVKVDSSGNIYIADTGNQRIRKVDTTTGIISTIAGNATSGYSGDGGQAASAQLNYPKGIDVDSGGNLYIVDSSNNRIRKVNVGTGIISTVAGTGIAGYSGNGGQATSAQLNYPRGVAVDSGGNIYIVDHPNNRIRKVNSFGIITTFAGGGKGDSLPATFARLDIPFRVSLDSIGNVYIADRRNNRIRKVNSSTGIISTVAGEGWSILGDGVLDNNPNLSYPYGVAVDSAGNIYIADTGNNRIRKIKASTGIISSVAGDGYNDSNNRGRYSGDGGQATSASLYFPGGVAVDSGGNIYIADSGNKRIRKINAITGIITTVAGNGTSGYLGDKGQATSAQLNPTGVAVDISGNIYIADSGNARIRKVIASTGIITTIAGNGTSGYSGDRGPATSASFNSPYDLALDSNGDIYIADMQNNRIRKVNASTGIITTIAGNGPFYPGGGYSGDGDYSTSAYLNQPYGVAVDNKGNIYIADSGNYRIRKLTKQ